MLTTFTCFSLKKKIPYWAKGPNETPPSPSLLRASTSFLLFPQAWTTGSHFALWLLLCSPPFIHLLLFPLCHHTLSLLLGLSAEPSLPSTSCPLSDGGRGAANKPSHASAGCEKHEAPLLLTSLIWSDPSLARCFLGKLQSRIREEEENGGRVEREDRLLLDSIKPIGSSITLLHMEAAEWKGQR